MLTGYLRGGNDFMECLLAAKCLTVLMDKVLEAHGVMGRDPLDLAMPSSVSISLGCSLH